MKRRLEGLHQADSSSADVFPDGLFLVRVRRVQYRWQGQKSYYTLQLEVLAPRALARHSLTGRLYCTPKALWKLNWFLRDFGYDIELLGRDEIDEKRLIGLEGVVKISNVVLHGTALLNLDGFAPAARWEELPYGISSVPPSTENSGSEVA